MLFALSVLDFRCKGTKFPRQTSRFVPFFSPFNILCRLLSHTQLTELRRNGYKTAGPSLDVSADIVWGKCRGATVPE